MNKDNKEKKDMKKRFLTILITLSLMLTMMPSAVFAAGSEDYGFSVSSEEDAARKDLEKAQDKYDKLKNECAEKEADYREKKEAADTARQEYDVAKAEKQAADQAAQNAADKLREAQADRSDKEAGRNAAQSNLNDQKAANPTAAQDLANAQAAAQQAQAEADAANAAYASAQAATDSAQAALNSKNAELGVARAEYGAAQANYNAKVSEANRAAANLRAAQQAYDAAVAVADNDPAVQAAKANLASAETALAAAESVATSARSELANANARLTQLQSECTTLENELAQTKASEEPYRAAVAEKQAALDAANSAKARADSAVTSAWNTKVSADNTVSAAQAELNAANENKAEAVSELNEKKADLADAKSDLAQAEKARDKAQSNLDAQAARVAAAQKAYDDIMATRNKGSLGFFEHEGSEKAAKIITRRVERQVDDTEWGKTNVGAEGDATSLENFRAALDFIKIGNDLRASDPNNSGVNKNPLKISDRMMAGAQIQANASAEKIDHSGLAGGAEILAWGFTNPYDGWYTKEKIKYDEGSTTGTGHYLILVNPTDERSRRYVVTGFGINTNGSLYATTFSQTFYNGNDEPMYTVDEYKARLDNYCNAVEQELAAAQNALNAAKAYQAELIANGGISNAEKKAIADATNRVTACAKAVTNAEQAVANATAVVNAAQTKFNNAKATQTQAANAVSSAEANAAEKANAVAGAQNALNGAKADLKTKTDATAAKQTQVNNKKAEVSTQQNTVRGKQDALNDANANVDSAKADKKDKEDKLTDAVENVASDIRERKANLDSAAEADEKAADELNQATSTLADKTAKKDAAETAKADAQSTYDTASTESAAKKSVKDEKDAAKAAADAVLAEMEVRNKAIVDAQKALDAAQAELDAAIAAETAVAKDKSDKDAAGTAAANAFDVKQTLLAKAKTELTPVQAAYREAKAALDEAQAKLDQAKAGYEALVVTDLTIVLDRDSYKAGEDFNGRLTAAVRHKDGSVTTIDEENDELIVNAPEIPKTLTADEVMTLANGGKVTRTVNVEYRGKTIEKTVDIEPVIYKAAPKQDRTYRRNLSDHAFIFSSDASISKFLNVVLIDGKAIKDFGVKEGSTVIYLTSDFMDSLSDGEHTITILSNDGYATTSFNVADAEATVQAGSDAGKAGSASVRTADSTSDKKSADRSGTVNTGDSAMIGTAVFAGLIAMIILAAMLFRRRKEDGSK